MANWVDVIALVSVAFFAFWGIQRGVMRTVLDVFAVLIAIFFAGQMYKFLSYTIMPFLKAQDQSVYAITFIIFWVIAFALVEILAGYILKIMRVEFIGTVETLGGGLLGFIQGILIVGIAIQLTLMFPLSQDTKGIFYSSLSKKISVPTLARSYSSIFGMFPKIDFFVQQKVIPSIPELNKVPQPEKKLNL
jgi:uncharacterized membrane protein required for colicin V production